MIDVYYALHLYKIQIYYTISFLMIVWLIDYLFTWFVGLYLFIYLFVCYLLLIGKVLYKIPLKVCLNVAFAYSTKIKWHRQASEQWSGTWNIQSTCIIQGVSIKVVQSNKVCFGNQMASKVKLFWGHIGVQRPLCSILFVSSS